tara:strand:- start:8050 stop:8811 length:762 start_codon:yes stop_codon:yes gene_type:complete
MKKFLITAAMALGLGTSAASAAPVNIGGVDINPGQNRLVTSTLYETAVQNLGDVLSGFGIVNTNTSAISGICAGCELTFEFGGFTLANISAPDLVGRVDLAFTGGWVNFYIDYNADWNPVAPSLAQATDGALWLSLAGHTDLHNGVLGTLFSDDVSNFGTGTDTGNSGLALFDVTGGMAAGNFNTDGVADNLGGLADFLFTSSFGPSGGEAGPGFPISGTGNMRGTIVSEPAALGLLGLGLIGMAAVARRRKG